MIPIHIQIGDITTLHVENWQTVPDDRQQMIEIVGGVVVQDYGHIAEGDKITCTVTIKSEDAQTLYGYWDNRTLVNVIDEAGNTLPNMRIIIKGYSYVKSFADRAYTVNLELWRI